MASAAGDDKVSRDNSGRRTRSSRHLTETQELPLPTRPRRRSSKKQQQEQLSDQEDEPKNFEKESFEPNRNQSAIIEEMLADSAHVAITLKKHNKDSEDTAYDEQPEANIEEITNEENSVVNDQVIEEDVEMYHAQENIGTVIVTDEKSSSFPFGNIAQSETSEEAQNEDEISEEVNESGTVENSLLASLAGDNANSLPSVGGNEEIENKREFNEKNLQILEKSSIDKIESDDSITEPAIAEDIGGDNNSDATIVNTEIVSEDELPLPAKPEINDAEEVSDEELPAPQRAELPADAEVISEDEFPNTNTSEKKSPVSSPQNEISKYNKQKRKADDNVAKSKSNEKDVTCEENYKKAEQEQYNPMSPTSDCNDSPPIEKKIKIDDNEYKEKKKNKDKEKEKDKDKEKEKEKEKDKEKERKRLPDLDEYWRSVKDDPADFTGWTYLLQYVDNESDAEAAREAYDAFLSHYPYCYGYWRKYADYEKRKGIKNNCNVVFERGLEAIPLSVDLWIHYLSHIKSTHADNEEYIRSQFERAIEACGLEFRSDKLWDAYLKWENDGKHYQRMVHIYDRLLAIPTQGYSNHFDNFQDLINQRPITSTIASSELKKIRIELRDHRALASRSKNRRGNSKEKEKDHEDDKQKQHSTNKETDSSQTIQKDTELSVESCNKDADIIEVEQENDCNQSIDLDDPSTLNDDEISEIKDKVISLRRKVHKVTVAAVTSRWAFEEGIKRPYFHVKPLERCQLKNWKEYLDFEIEKGDRKRVLVLFERCLIACALYDEFWLKMIRYLETQMEQPGIPALTSDVFRRACQIHHPDKPSLHLMWAAFEECHNNFDGAANILINIEKKCPNLLQIAYRRINIERRRGDLNKCRELYENYINTAKNKMIASSLAIKYARFLNKICNNLNDGFKVLQEALERDPANARVALQMIDLALQRSNVDEDEIVCIMDKFMARENIEPEQKVLFAQRKVEFLEDFGSTARGLQDAQRGLQLALNKANEAKKKRDASPSRKTVSSAKDNTNSSAMTSQVAYNSASSNNYNYNSANNGTGYYNQQNSGNYQPQSYDNYYNQWQYGSGYSGYNQWSGYGNYY